MTLLFIDIFLGPIIFRTILWSVDFFCLSDYKKKIGETDFF